MRKIQIIGVLLLAVIPALGACAPGQTPKPPEAGFFLTLETELVGNKLTISQEGGGQQKTANRHNAGSNKDTSELPTTYTPKH